MINEVSPPAEKPEKLSYTKKVWIAVGIIALVVTVIMLFKTLFSLILLILAGVLIANYFHGCANLLKRYLHLPAKLSIILSVFLNLLLLTGFFWFVGARIQQQVSALSDTLPKTIEQAKDQMKQNPLGNKVLNYLNSSGDNQKTMAVAKSFFSSGFGILSDFYIVVLIGLFFTASPFLYKKGIVHLLPPKAKDKGADLISQISEVLKRWIKGQLIGFVFIALLSGTGLLILDMPLVLTLALIAGLMNFIPNFGPIIALIPAVLIALLQGPNTAVLVICIYTGIQIIQSAVMQPLVQKKMINLPPALIIISQVAMGILGGFWGVLLATPIVAILMTVVNDLYVKPQGYHKYAVE